jgi:predicted ATPase/DNA-binding SARP family transcriptional activator
MQFRVLGSFEVLDGDRTLALGTAKQRALLAILLLHANQVVPRDRLIDDLWPEEPPETAVASLHVYVSRLRKVLPPNRLVRRSPGYELRIDADELDAERFERLVADARISIAAGDAERGSRVFADALALWRGPALGDFGAEPWARPESARLDELRATTTEESVDAELALGRHAESIGELEALLADQPSRERAREQLMLALYRAGRQADALSAYREGRAALAELGLEPSERLRSMERRILNHDLSLKAPRRVRIATRVELPVPTTSFVGREREVSEVVAALASGRARVLTLTGAGGSGKTRLALAAASRLADNFPHGVFFVPLEHVREASLVVPAISRALGVDAPPDELEVAIVRRLGDRRVLLVLDNFEQVLGAAPAVARLVTATNAFLVTSRAPLHISAEREYPVPTLPPHDARELFVDRARAVTASFQTSRTVGAICQRLDNLPLAIELAAARVKMLAPEAMLPRLNSRLSLLTGGPRDMSSRQQTLRAALDWSYDLLPDDARKLLARLAVFVGEFDLAAAERVCEADLDTLQLLVDNNLVRADGERFSLLDSVREYASERMSKSGDGDAVRLRHARYFAAQGQRMVEGAEHGGDGGVMVRWLIANAGNLEAAAGVLKETSSGEDEWRVAEPLAIAQSHAGARGQALQTLEQYLAATDLPEAQRCRLEALAAWTAGDCGRHVRGRELAAAAAARARRVNDPLSEIRALGATSLIESETGDLSVADEAEREAEAVARAHLPAHVPLILANRALIALARDEFESARALLDEALALTDGTGRGIWSNLALSYLLEGRPSDAEPWLRRVLLYDHDIGARGALVYALNGYVALHAGEQPERAARLSGALESLRAELGIRLQHLELRLARQTRETLASRLGDRLYELEAAGAEMELDDVVALALES